VEGVLTILSTFIIFKSDPVNMLMRIKVNLILSMLLCFLFWDCHILSGKWVGFGVKDPWNESVIDVKGDVSNFLMKKD